MKCKMIYLVFVLNIVVCMPLYAHYFIDSPSPEAILQGDYSISMRIGPGGGLLVRLSSIPFDGLFIGLSYGGEKILGYEDPLFYRSPGIEARVLIIEEALLIPRLLLGFDSQGYDRDDSNFKVRSKGIYALLGKNIAMFQSGIGMNYNTEDSKIGFFGGTILSLSPTFSFVGDYSIYPDEENGDFFGLGARINFEGVLLQFTFRDIMGEKIGRALDLGYTGCF